MLIFTSPLEDPDEVGESLKRGNVRLFSRLGDGEIDLLVVFDRGGMLGLVTGLGDLLCEGCSGFSGRSTGWSWTWLLDTVFGFVPRGLGRGVTGIVVL